MSLYYLHQWTKLDHIWLFLMCYLPKHIVQFVYWFIFLFICDLFIISIIIQSFLPIILDNIWTLLVKNIWPDLLVQEMDIMVNIFHSCIQYKYRVIIWCCILLKHNKDHILSGRDLKYHSNHDKASFLLQYSILETIWCSVWFWFCVIFVFLFLTI